MADITNKMLDFIDASPTCFHVVDNLKKELVKNGYVELSEKEEWNLKAKGKYFVTRNDSSIISFRIPKKDFKGFYMIASHSDSPSFKIKENPEMEAAGAYVKLNVERYGGMLCAPWFDRPLSVAGRVFVKGKKGIESRLVNVDRDLVMLPSLAIHMNREANDGYKYNAQTDMLPIFGDEASKDSFFDVIAKSAGVKKDDILSHDLFLYNRVKWTTWGANNEYISCSRLDDQECVYSSFDGFLKGKEKENVPVHCVFDNEEVGSGTKQGAASTFLKATLVRINECLGRTTEQYYTALANSFMVSADNAHAVHPNHIEKADPVNRPVMNKGIVIKYNANQKYTTDAFSAAFFKNVCEKAKVPYQTFTNRSDTVGGSTLGNISTTQVAVDTVDIGLAQLAMHSPYESAGAKDPEYLAKASKEFYSL
ncbi:M18 family aminopeptidase [Butyrivibrio sp.]|uniref:M18 family aminopeptidase n=1 Tax=Butyrivibrio sp. TaxID=28121 RepID=UPI001B4E524C|nr:M18 family aminopeptidase [Butyrivibrio sp.]MBE5838291.1 M18 family aminopeptidase [Butyrivibrio sp.]MBP3817048.1 M18 family aminopeptidase [Butyrivibrio sp.]MBQ6416550.1 M18 family aminopeptidase [Butyrivibrio sp.]MBQ9304273.1 M18 family aminopeptidase [Butyrivibrio sp.]